MEDQQATFSASTRHRNHSKHRPGTGIGTGTGNTIASEPSQPWTATRCHRLLRPLLTHIAALRKCKERQDTVHSSALQGQATKPRRTVLGKRSYPGSDSDYSEKKTCRKYSRRGSRRRAS